MKKPIIGIIGSISYETEGIMLGHEKIHLNKAYVDSVVKAGGIPVILPIVSDEDLIKQQVESVEGIIVSGGQDIDSLLYNEEPIEKQGYITPERDIYDISVVKYAHQLKRPILGICRGIQALNVAFGGTLYQDISQIPGSYIKHSQKARPDFPTHTIEIKKETILFDILGSTTTVNSFHHQAVKDVAPGFRISAISKDGVIEAIEMEKEDFIVGVQWHPELMASKGNEDMLKIFQKLLYYASKL
ncbi:MAG TPA: gamma-glutamyl-gamma-aminobutyrate hydrolase family protein [Clostridia bacterium]|nr:gamma-glutamyl-gamma-aminobutyrate hydrolase family protein [Clostridia bacterium]